MLYYFFQLRHPIAILALTVLAGTMIAFRTGLLSKSKTQLLLAGLFILAALHFTRAGSGHNGRNLHFNEFTHYYFGGKYFKEVGYTKLYQALALGLEETGLTKIETIRNLEDKSRYVSREQFMRQAELTRNLFSPARWEELRQDLIAFHTATAGQITWQQALRDAGYNVSPAGVLSSRVFTWISPKFFHLITSIDVVLLLATMALLARSFGSVAMLAAGSLVMLFPSGTFAIFDYSGGSCLRMLWVFWLTLGLALYHRHPLASGGAFALAALERIFPAAFAVAALAISVSQIISLSTPADLKRWRTWRHPMLLIGGQAGVGAAIFILSSLTWPGSWGVFFPYILNHSQTLLFTNHFGWWRAVAFYPGIAEIAFSPENPEIFADWSRYLRERLQWPYFRVLALGIGGTIWLRSARVLPGAAAIGLMGFALIFLASLPAHYYLVMLLPIGATLADKKVPSPLVIAFWLTWPLCSVVTTLNEVAGWALASILILLFLIFAAAYSLPISRHRVSAALGSVVLFVSLQTVVLHPNSGHLAPRRFRNAQSVSLEFQPTTPRAVPRTFLDESGALISDTGLILRPGMKAILRPRLNQSSGTIRVILRTDRFFSGTLSLSDTHSTLYNWEVKSRGYLFDYLEATVPFRSEYQLEWTGRGDIGLFQAWVTGE